MADNLPLPFLIERLHFLFQIWASLIQFLTLVFNVLFKSTDFRFLDTTLIDVDLHPKYITIKIKGKILQLTFDEEIQVDKSTCQRSQTTGHLVVKMPKINAVIKPKTIDSKKEEKKIPPPSYGYPSK